jgi:hypothetical protein
MENIETVIGEPAARIASELGVDVSRVTLGDDIGPSQRDGAEHRWPLFVDGAAHGWLWDTAVGYELADSGPC